MSGTRTGLRVYFDCDTLEFIMRTSTFPPIRVEPEMRAQTEAVLREGESLHEERGGPTLAEVQVRMQQRATKGAERIRAAVASRARAA
jgi:hypothetical protein